MSTLELSSPELSGRSAPSLAILSSTVPKVLFGVRLWAAVCLALYVAYSLELDNAYWAATSAAAVSLPSLGASLRKGVFRMLGTVVGGVAIVALAACFPQNRGGFLLGLALWGALCGFVSMALRNSASYGAALAGFTGVIVGGDALGAFGGVSGDVFNLALTRVAEICIGIVCSGIVLAGTDFGGARKRLTGQFAVLSAGITGGLADTLLHTGLIGEETRSRRRDLTRRVIALDAMIDEAIGEESDLHARAAGLRAAVEGLLAGLVGWTVIANHLELLPHDRRRREAEAVLQCVPLELRSLLVEADPARWLSDVERVRFLCSTAVRALVRWPAETPSLRMVTDGTAEALLGISAALNGLSILMNRGPILPTRALEVGLPDILPPATAALRVFITIVAATFFWIATAWSNGVLAMTWAAIFVTISAARADQAYAYAKNLLLGVCLAATLAAIVKFAVLPGNETFASVAVAIGLVLVPASILSTLGWHAPTFTAITSWFIPLIGLENQITYDTQQFYNSALAIVAGAGAATLVFRLLPPLSPEVRALRLLALTLRDLRQLATALVPPTQEAWKGRIYKRLSVLPDGADALQRAQFLSALSMGTDILRLRHIAPRFEFGSDLDRALNSIARGDNEGAVRSLARIDRRLAVFRAAHSGVRVGLRARGLICAMSEALVRHGAYFGWQERA
jgi:uncharacterized membrane protein YccC